MSKPMKFLRLLNGETTYKNFEFLYAMLKVTARDRSVQRENTLVMLRLVMERPQYYI